MFRIANPKGQGKGLFPYALSEYKQAVVAYIAYIAGYAAKMAKKKLTCEPCTASLGSVTSAPLTPF